MRRTDFARYESVVNLKRLIVDEEGLDVYYWRKLMGETAATKSGNLNKRIPITVRSSLSSEKIISVRKFDKGSSRRTRRSRVGSVETTPEERAEEISVPEVPFLRGNSSSSNEDPIENRAPPRRQPLQPPPAAMTGQTHHSKVSGLTNRKVPLLLRSPPVASIAPLQEPPKASIAPLQEQPKASIALPQEPPKASIARMQEPPTASIVSPQEPPKASIAPPQGPSAVSLAIQTQPEKVGPPKPPPPPKMMSTPPEILTSSKAPPPPPPPPPPKMTSTPPELLTSSKAPPPPPPLLPRRPPKAADSASSVSKPPPPPPLSLRPSKIAAKVGEDPSSSGDQVKMKPLHWEKVNIDGEHSMVWNKIDGGSFRVDGDLMEALFGSAATNRKPIQETNTKTEAAKSAKPDPPSKIFILDIRKSQNIAIILRSLGVPQKDIFQALDDGHGLIAETIERLNQIVLTKEEQTRILRFDCDTSRLADAESFLYRLLKAYPSAFARLNAMLFKLNYDSEVAQLKESIKVMELGCRELRRGGVFVKLLEAILKAGNRMNAGTARGDAAAFNLNSLKKLSDVKSSDGKTTLLHFVVEEVVRSEGKRNRTNSSADSDTVRGLAVVRGLGVEFLNVKKAAGIDFKSFSASASGLSSRLVGYRREMKEFLEGAEEELELVRRTQVETLELVKKTTEYYQAGGGGSREDNPLQIFVVVKDFLAMVDKVCAEISRDLQRKKVAPRATAATITTTPAAVAVPPVKFMNLPSHFMSEKSNSASDDDSDTEF